MRWEAVTHSGSYPCSFSTTLFADGRIRFDYGEGNTPITATVGVSSGDGERYMLSAYDAQPDLGQATSLLIDFSHLPDGLVMNADGVITGLPAKAGMFKPIFHVVDQSQRTDTKMIPLSVLSDLFGDFDMNGEVDLDDFSEFVNCTYEQEPSWMCLAIFDSDDSMQIDLRDFVVFQSVFGE